VDVRVPLGDVVPLSHDDASRLVDALWEVSATPGAVIAVGKINYELRAGDTGTVELTNRESGALRKALARVEKASEGLLALRRALER
jgi:hypothetical protein